MRAHFQVFRRFLQIAMAALAVGALLSCATKKEKSSTKPAAAAVGKTKKPGASPPPTAAPVAVPPPQEHYVATVSVDGGTPTEKVLGPNGDAISSPSPTPKPTPQPTPKPKGGPLGLVTGAWRKVFHPKATPAPTPGETGRVTIRVSNADGQSSEQVAHEGMDDQSGPVPSPTPIMVKLRPTEGFLTRMWHRIRPPKKEPPVAAPPEWLGTIKLVNEREGYALIDAPASFALSTGETLNSVSPESESGVLRVTADREAPFFIADIVNGKPRAGDRVYSPKP